MLASLIEIPLTPFGAVVLWLGLLQGIGVEAVFAATRYRNWRLPVLLLAGALGASLPYFGYTYSDIGRPQLDIGDADPSARAQAGGRRLFARSGRQADRRCPGEDRRAQQLPDRPRAGVREI